MRDTKIYIYIYIEREREREDVSFLVRDRRRETTVEALRSTKLKEMLKRFQSREKKKNRV